MALCGYSIFSTSRGRIVQSSEGYLNKVPGLCSRILYSPTLVGRTIGIACCRRLSVLHLQSGFSWRTGLLHHMSQFMGHETLVSFTFSLSQPDIAPISKGFRLNL